MPSGPTGSEAARGSSGTSAGVDPGLAEELLAGVLCRCRRVVEGAHRVRRVAYRQDEAVEAASHGADRAAAAEQPLNAPGLNFLNAASSSSGSPPIVAARASPRQCIGPASAMPRRLCVVIGPFIGWNGLPPPTRNGLGCSSGVVARTDHRGPTPGCRSRRRRGSSRTRLAVRRRGRRVVEEAAARSRPPAGSGVAQRTRCAVSPTVRRCSHAPTIEIVWSKRFIT